MERNGKTAEEGTRFHSSITVFSLPALPIVTVQRKDFMTGQMTCSSSKMLCE